MQVKWKIKHEQPFMTITATIVPFDAFDVSIMQCNVIRFPKQFDTPFYW